MTQGRETNIEHGTEVGYNHHGCRCDHCRAASAEARARRRAREPREQLRAKWRDEKRRQREARNVAFDRSNTRGLEDALAVEEGAWQLTIDGGAVRHPPPAPRGKCPDCEKLITFNSDGTYREHNIYNGERCPSSGRKVNR